MSTNGSNSSALSSASASQVMPELSPREEADIYRIQRQIEIWISKTEHRLQFDMSRWKPRVNDTMRGTYNCVISFMNSFPEQRRKAVATKLYWINDDTTVCFALSESLGVPFASLEQHLYLYPTHIDCHDCGNSGVIYRQSRDEEIRYTCPHCAEEMESAR
jgi:hypothetical protein